MLCMLHRHVGLSRPFYVNRIYSFIQSYIYIYICIYIYIYIITCSAILALLDKDDDLRARHELLNTERIL